MQWKEEMLQQILMFNPVHMRFLGVCAEFQVNLQLKRDLFDEISKEKNKKTSIWL